MTEKKQKPAKPVAAQSEAERLLAIELRAGHLRHTTTLALTAAGGIVTLAGSIFRDAENLTPLWIAAGIFAGAALLSFIAANVLIEGLRNSKDRRLSVTITEALATYGLCLGTGYFLMSAIKALGG